MNAPMRRVAVTTLILFALLIANANYVQVVESSKLRNDPGNTRVLLAEYKRQRGSIVVDGRSIAESRATSDKLKYQRFYPGGAAFAPATGFYSLIYGADGIERIENNILTGNDDRLLTRRLSDLLTGRDPRGGNVVLTLNSRAQQVAYQSLAKQRGAVVALDARTGAILAMATSPSYDPNPLATHDTTGITKAYQQYVNDPNNPLLDRAINQTYPPGSTFKVVVAAAALQSGLTPNSLIDCQNGYQLPQSTSVLHNFADEPCPAPRVTMQEALTLSLNTAFAKLGDDVGEPAIRRQAEAFGINDQDFSVPLRVSGSSIGPIPDAAALAQSSIGQRDVRLTAMQGAMIAAAVANHGVLMKPYLINELQASDLTVISQTQPQQQSVAVPPNVADQLTQMMRSVVQNGTGTAAQIPGVDVAGKTGTAENVPGAPPHAWFIGFANSGGRQVAVAVIIENGGVTGSETTGGKAAAPVAKAVMQAVLGSPGGG